MWKVKKAWYNFKMYKKIKTDLFWFVKEGAQFDLDDPSTRQMYVQHVLSRGKEGDIRELLRDIGIQGVKSAFEQCRRFIPVEIRNFWEDFFADHNSISKPAS